MPEALRRRPGADEYDPFYETYVGVVPAGGALAAMRDQLADTCELLAGVSPEASAHRYATGKWSLAEVVGHVVDMEWVFAYRALSFARGDAGPLPGVDQDRFMANASFADLTALIAQYRSLRTATIALYSSFDDLALGRRGVASDCPCSVRAIGYIIAGHERHHIAVLRERYLNR